MSDAVEQTIDAVEKAIEAAEKRAINLAKHCVAVSSHGNLPCYSIGFDNLRRLVKDLANEKAPCEHVDPRIEKMIPVNETDEPVALRSTELSAFRLQLDSKALVAAIEELDNVAARRCNALCTGNTEDPDDVASQVIAIGAAKTILQMLIPFADEAARKLRCAQVDYQQHAELKMMEEHEAMRRKLAAEDSR